MDDTEPQIDAGGADRRITPVLHDAAEYERLAHWVATTMSSLQERLERVRGELRAELGPEDRAALGAAIERLQMLQIVESGLVVGDTLPDFALPDTDGRIWTSDMLLAEGPLVLAFVRGTWCPYCSLALQALDEARAPLEALGGKLVVVSPQRAAELAQAAVERGLKLTLLSDSDARYAQICGVRYAMSEGHADMYRRFGLNLDRLNAGAGWSLPVPATYVVGPDGVITFAHADVDWARRAEPAEIVAAVRRLGQAASTED